MPHHSRDTLELHPQPSLALRVFIVASHVVALVVCAYLISRTLWALVLPVPVLCSAGYLLRRQNKDHARRVVRLIWAADGQWHWYTQAGIHAEGRHLGTSLRLPWLVILHLRSQPQGRFTSVILPYDSLPSSQHRRLRVRLHVDSVAPPK